MTNAPQNSDLAATWQVGGVAAAVAQLPAAETTLRLNISYLPTPEQSRIWTFLEFMHEYSSTAWNLQSGDDADIWFVDGNQDFAPPTGAVTSAAVVYVVGAPTHTAPSDINFLVQPLEMEAFAALLQRLEKNAPPQDGSQRTHGTANGPGTLRT